MKHINRIKIEQRRCKSAGVYNTIIVNSYTFNKSSKSNSFILLYISE